MVCLTCVCCCLQVLAESNPSRYGFLWRRFDELYLLLDVLLQNHFLSHCSASFSENFYGLKRVSGGRGDQLGLNRKSHWRSLLLLCLVPYLRAKLEATLAQQRDEEDFSIRLGQSKIDPANVPGRCGCVSLHQLGLAGSGLLPAATLCVRCIQDSQPTVVARQG